MRQIVHKEAQGSVRFCKLSWLGTHDLSYEKCKCGAAPSVSFSRRSVATKSKIDATTEKDTAWLVQAILDTQVCT